MTKRERELATRHRDELVDARDRAWEKVIAASNTSPYLQRHAALAYAIALIDAALAKPEAKVKSAA